MATSSQNIYRDESRVRCCGESQFSNRKKISELPLGKKPTNCHSNCFVAMTQNEFFKSFQEQLIFLKIKSKYVYKLFIHFQNVYRNLIKKIPRFSIYFKIPGKKIREFF